VTVCLQWKGEKKKIRPFPLQKEKTREKVKRDLFGACHRKKRGRGAHILSREGKGGRRKKKGREASVLARKKKGGTNSTSKGNLGKKGGIGKG